MDFSIIVPVYNVQKYIDRCVESLLSQTYKSFEIILIDDGSTDDSGIICDEYLKKNEKIKVIHKNNSGLSDARNEGLAVASGEYIIFIDSDDWIKPDTLESFKRFIVSNGKNKIDLFIGAILNEDSTRYSVVSKAVINQVYNGIDYYMSFNESIINCSVASVYRREFLIENKLFFPSGKLHEDFYFTPKVYIYADKVVYTDIGFYYRFVREESITQVKDKRNSLRDVLWISRELYEYSKKLNNTGLCKTLRNNIVNSYLSKFYDANIYQYKKCKYKEYIDKKLVAECSYGIKNKMKGILFIFSPRVYIYINKISKSFAR